MRHQLPKISIPDTDDNPPWHCPLHSRWIDVHLKCHGQRRVFILYMVWKIGFDLVYQNTLKQGGWTFPNPYIQVNLWGLPFIPVAFLHRHGIVQASTSEAFQVLQSLQLCRPKLGPKSMYQVFSKKIQNFIGTFGFWDLKSLKTKRSPQVALFFWCRVLAIGVRAEDGRTTCRTQWILGILPLQTMQSATKWSSISKRYLGN